MKETFEAFAVFFAGVLLDTWRAAYRAANRELWAAYSRGEIDRHFLHEQRFAIPFAQLGLDPGRAKEVGAFYFLAYRRHWRLNEGATEILEDAARLGIAGIVSNGFFETQKGKIARFRLERFLSHVILSEEVGCMKPGRAIFDAAVTASGAAAGVRKLYIGDSLEHDVFGAKSAGWLPVLYNPSGATVPAPVMYVKRLVDLKPLLE